MIEAPLDALRDAALAREPDRYFAATLAHEAVRGDLIALAAFAAELDNIPRQVREPLAGEIRLQWWRDALLASSDQAAAGNPIAVTMREAIARHNLPAEIIEGVIDSFADVLHGERPADESALMSRMAAGEGGLFLLAARVAMPAASGDLLHISRAAGVAYGLSRALLYLPSEGAARLPLPHTLISDDELSEAAADGRNPRLAVAVAALGEMARRAKAGIAPELANLSRGERVPFLPLAMLRPNLRALEAWMQRSSAALPEPLPFTRLLRITWAHLSGRL